MSSRNRQRCRHGDASHVCWQTKTRDNRPRARFTLPSILDISLSFIPSPPPPPPPLPLCFPSPDSPQHFKKPTTNEIDEFVCVNVYLLLYSILKGSRSRHEDCQSRGEAWESQPRISIVSFQKWRIMLLLGFCRLQQSSGISWRILPENPRRSIPDETH